MTLQDENVNSSFYSSSNFITIFTQVMQNQTTSANMHLLQRVWDYFIIVSAGTLMAAVWVESHLQGHPFGA